MSWESTVTYYQIINTVVKEQRGGLHSPKILLYSVDFAEIERYQASAEWNKSAEVLADAAERLEKAGADFIVICTNTMHKVAPDIAQRIHIPILHIADATAEVLCAERIKTVGLLGTKYTLTQDFYKKRLIDKGLEVIIPEPDEIELINAVIYNELCRGLISDKSRMKYLDIIGGLQKKGAEAVILGCTEIGLLISKNDVKLPVFDTTLIHAQLAAQKAINTGN